MSKPCKNIRQINACARELRKNITAWKLGEKVYNISIVVSEIADFLVDCQALLEKGTLPSKPGQEMSKKTRDMLEKRIVEFRGKQAELLRRSSGAMAKTLSRGYDRFDYEETNQQDESRTFVNAATIIPKSFPKVRVGSYVRDY